MVIVCVLLIGWLFLGALVFDASAGRAGDVP